jgi:hypothetical protein
MRCRLSFHVVSLHDTLEPFPNAVGEGGGGKRRRMCGGAGVEREEDAGKGRRGEEEEEEKRGTSSHNSVETLIPLSRSPLGTYVHELARDIVRCLQARANRKESILCDPKLGKLALYRDPCLPELTQHWFLHLRTYIRMDTQVRPVL